MSVDENAMAVTLPHPGPLVLVIDDDPFMREMARIHLEGAGYRIILAKGGADGLDKTLTLLPDLVVLDYAMPGLSGWDILQKLRKDPRTETLPVIMLTAWSSEQNRRQVKSLGATWVEKPVSGETLISTVKRLAPDKTAVLATKGEA